MHYPSTIEVECCANYIKYDADVRIHIAKA